MIKDIKINWEGYQEAEQLPSTSQPPIQTEKSLMGYGKSLKEPVKSAFSEKPEIKLRQVPCDGMVCYATIPRKTERKYSYFVA